MLSQITSRLEIIAVAFVIFIKQLISVINLQKLKAVLRTTIYISIKFKLFWLFPTGKSVPKWRLYAPDSSLLPEEEIFTKQGIGFGSFGEFILMWLVDIWRWALQGKIICPSCSTQWECQIPKSEVEALEDELNEPTESQPLAVSKRRKLKANRNADADTAGCGSSQGPSVPELRRVTRSSARPR